MLRPVASFAPAIALLTLLSACQQPTTYGPRATPEEIAAEQAYQQQLYDQFQAQGGTVKTWRKKKNKRQTFERVADRIERAGAQLCAEMGIPAENRSCYYFFDTKDGDELNAYADGKNVIVYDGMMQFVENDEELAAVLAHELAHNMMGHPDATKNNAMVGGLIGAAAQAIAASQGISGGDFVGMGMQAGVTGYSSEFETEADYVSLYIMERAGYDISRVPHLWERMALERPEGIYVSVTHPTYADRYVTLKKTINEIGSKKQLRFALLPERIME